MRTLACLAALAAVLIADPALAWGRKKAPSAPPPIPGIENAGLCVVGQRLEGKAGSPYHPWISGKVIEPGLGTDGSRCRISYDAGGLPNYTRLDEIRPLAGEALAAVQKADAAVAAAPPHVLQARRTYQAQITDKCRFAQYGIAGGEDLAQDVVRSCRFQPDQWDEAMKLGPLNYDPAPLRAKAAQEAVWKEDARAASVRWVDQQNEEARQRMIRNAPPAYTGGLGLNTTPNYSSAMSTPATGAATGAPSEVQTRQQMQSNACMANASRC